MSNNNGGGWKPRKREPYKCKDGTIVYVRRPGPEFALRISRIPRSFTKTLSALANEDGDPEEKMALLSDEEQDNIAAFARQYIVAMMDEPKLVLDPNPDLGQLGPDDTGDDFWPLFFYAMTNFHGIKVPVSGGEVEVKDLETFRPESGIQRDSVDGVHIPSREAESGDAST